MTIFNAICLTAIVVATLYLLITADEKECPPFSIGLGLGVMLSLQALALVANIFDDGVNYRADAKVLIAECERSLPRDQKCIIEMVAVVDKSPDK